MRIWQMAALFMAALLICLLVLAPMSMIKTRAEAAVPGLRVKAADGTVWRGRLQGVSLKDERFGTIELRARPLSLLLLRLASGFKVSGSRFDAQGNAGVSLINGGWRLEQTTLEADLARANIRDPIPIRGRVTLTIDRMTGTKDQCADARGMASSNALEQSLGIIEWKGPVVEGPISCENGRVV
ncbi:MAG: type II secretion system protein N, partial [Pseudomonadota bacterium]